MRVGVTDIDGNDRTVRFDRLMARLQETFPVDEAGHAEWIGFAQTWAEWAALRWGLEGTCSTVFSPRPCAT